jgi:hypothetical protein
MHPRARITLDMNGKVQTIDAECVDSVGIPQSDQRSETRSPAVPLRHGHGHLAQVDCPDTIVKRRPHGMVIYDAL